MAKPILVINYCIDGMSMSMTIRNLRELQQVISESNANDDYYTFLLPVKTDSHIQVFYDKDFNKIKYDELKKMIETKIKNFREKGSEEDEMDISDIEDMFSEKPSLFKKLFNKFNIF
jgi:predicted RNase H-like nuclease (RuvC/YqgF family)